MQRRFNLMGNRTFLLGLAILIGFCYVVYLAYDSNAKLRVARERADYAKHEYETLSVQVQQILDLKAKLEKQLQSERNELRKVKADKDYIDQQRKELFSKLQEFTQTEKTLKAQQADLQQALEKANRELTDLRADKEDADHRNQAEFARLNTEKDLEISKLRDELADLKRRYEEAQERLTAGALPNNPAAGRAVNDKIKSKEPELLIPSELTSASKVKKTDRSKSGAQNEDNPPAPPNFINAPGIGGIKTEQSDHNTDSLLARKSEPGNRKIAESQNIRKANLPKPVPVKVPGAQDNGPTAVKQLPAPVPHVGNPAGAHPAHPNEEIPHGNKGKNDAEYDAAKVKDTENELENQQGPRPPIAVVDTDNAYSKLNDEDVEAAVSADVVNDKDKHSQHLKRHKHDRSDANLEENRNNHAVDDTDALR